MRTCNSPFYGLPRRVKTLSRAVALLGFKAVRNLVLVHSLPWRRTSTAAFAEQLVWTHSTSVALASRIICDQTKVGDPEEALLGGLMHDAGRLALNLILPEEYSVVMREIYNREGRSVDLEQAALGLDHTMAGEMVLRKWSFPDELVRIAADHHKPPADLDPLTQVIQAADEVAWIMGLGVCEMADSITQIPPGLAHLGYELEELAALEDVVANAVEQAQEVFGSGA